uniref:Uncharacterized protein n=1 Tax=Brassica oleracea TaxID=3712 RepID=A0A3P6EKV7_BRAOL|nr:unnamed protein product [Brassica oleracea]
MAKWFLTLFLVLALATAFASGARNTQEDSLTRRTTSDTVAGILASETMGCLLVASVVVFLVPVVILVLVDFNRDVTDLVVVPWEME